jgi:hypothetical protein
MNLVINADTIQKLRDRSIPPISEFDEEEPICWFIPRKVQVKKTKKGKEFWVLEVIDINNETARINCWGITKSDTIQINRPYMSKLDFDPKWGFSTRSIRRNFRLLH